MKNPRARILLVDDEPAIRLSYQAILEGERYAVDCAASAAEACARLEQSSYDLVISDLTLEEHDSGIKVLACARGVDPELPAVLLTGHAEPEIPERFSNDGIQLLLKPVNIASMLSTVDFLVRSYQMRRPPGESA